MVQILSGICIRNFQQCYSNRWSLARVDGYFFCTFVDVSPTKTGGVRKLEKTILLKILNRRGLVQMRTDWQDGRIITQLILNRIGLYVYSFSRDPYILTMVSYQLHECLTYFYKTYVFNSDEGSIC